MKLLALSMLSLTLTTNAVQADSGNEQHYPGIFIGATNFDSEFEFTYGIEYEYKFSNQWGAGFVYEKTNDAHHGDGVNVKLASLYFHPLKYLRLGAGIGKEKVGGHHPHTENLTRISASYDFHFAGLGIAPTLAFDFIDGETATVFGIAFIKPF
jgi:hypothetical protein